MLFISKPLKENYQWEQTIDITMKFWQFFNSQKYEYGLMFSKSMFYLSSESAPQEAAAAMFCTETAVSMKDAQVCAREARKQHLGFCAVANDI